MNASTSLYTFPKGAIALYTASSAPEDSEHFRLARFSNLSCNPESAQFRLPASKIVV